MNFRQIYFSIVLTLLPAYFLGAQNLFVSNIKNNIVFANPAFASVNDFSLVQLNYLNQWPIDGIYNTYGAAAFHSLNNLNSNIGAVINYDRQSSGVFNTYSAGINYSYKLRVSNHNNLAFGIFGSYNYQKLDYSVLDFENPTTSMPANQSKSYPLISFGLAYIIRDEHSMGVSFVNLYNLTDNPLIESHANISYAGNLDLRRMGSSISSVEPVGNLKISTTTIETSLGCNVVFYNFKSGLLINLVNANLSSTAILLGISFENYDLIYTYDLLLSKSVTINPKMAAHEVTFLWKYQYKGRRKRRGAIKCPDI